ncbi:4-hydroxy-tetrahydrodipicolinate synthase [Beduinella massiliensis]|uniref:4-hydroxy-tetrahydrodipicolinate synthase n=1 Tax=Beduinella massiliensis TaxID=1852363 RepID=UPI000C845EE8
MKKKPVFRGSAVALVTPFDSLGVDYDALLRLVDRQIDAGTDALVVLGTTGEPSTLADSERRAVLSAVIERAGGRIPVVAGTGSNDTRRAVHLAREAAALGADAQLCVTPYYNKATQRGLVQHFTAVADAAPLPLILYNVPSRTGVNLLPETVQELCAHENVAGVKEAVGDVVQVAELFRLCHDEIAIYSGNDDQTLPLLAYGGDGVISVAANVCPGAMVRMTHAYFAGDVKAARDAQLTLLPLMRALFMQVNPIPVKAALSLLGLCENRLRLPLTALEGEDLDRLRRALGVLDGELKD